MDYWALGRQGRHNGAMSVESTVSVAVVDDHAMVSDAVSRSLIARGMRVVYCGTSTAEAASSRPDVALLDVDLGPGAEPLADRLSLLLEADCRVVVVSALEKSVEIRDAILAGALGFVPKRAPLDTLCEAVESAAAGQLFLSTDLATILATASERPDLSERELTALQLWASGLTLSLMGAKMGVSPHTAREYLDRVRAKYASVGRPARTRTEMYAVASHDGFLRD